MNYLSFANVYDILMNDVDYKGWADYINKVFNRYKANPKLMLELCCGTGSITLELAKSGIEMIALDKSLEMLNIAQQKAYNDKQNILFINQNMTDFELYGTVDTVGCFMDGINYITDIKHLRKMLNLVHNYLNPRGLFIFDIRSEYGLTEVVGNNTFAENVEEVSYIWNNSFNKKSKISNMELTLFTKDGDAYRKTTEIHKLRAYSEAEINEELAEAGFEVLDLFENLTFKRPDAKSQRIFWVVRKKN